VHQLLFLSQLAFNHHTFAQKRLRLQHLDGLLGKQFRCGGCVWQGGVQAFLPFVLKAVRLVLASFVFAGLEGVQNDAASHLVSDELLNYGPQSRYL